MLNLTKIVLIILCAVLIFSLSSFAEQASVQGISPKFQVIDVSGDGFISPSEMQAYQVKKFNELDKDKNGVLSAQELKADKAKVFAGADKNGDSQVTKAEATDQFKAYFNAMDKNKDGKVSNLEFNSGELVYKF